MVLSGGFGDRNAGYSAFVFLIILHCYLTCVPTENLRKLYTASASTGTIPQGHAYRAEGFPTTNNGPGKPREPRSNKSIEDKRSRSGLPWKLYSIHTHGHPGHETSASPREPVAKQRERCRRRGEDSRRLEYQAVHRLPLKCA